MKKYLLLIVILILFPYNASSSVLKVGTDSDIQSLDPQFVNEGATNNVTFSIFDGLVDRGKNLDPFPVLAKSWQIIDKLTWQFELRRNVLFHNGNPFTADDVIWTFNRMKHGEMSGFKGTVTGIQSIEKVDDYTVNIITNGPYPILLNKLSYLRIMDKEYCENLSDEEIGSNPIGTGPYQLQIREKGKKIVLQSNKQYHRRKPAIDTVEIYPLPDESARVKALSSKQVDMITRVPVNAVKQVQSNSDFNFFGKSGLRLIFLQTDTKRDKSPYISGVEKNPFKDPKVRKALYYGINEEAISLLIMQRYAKPAAQFYPSAVTGHDRSITRPRYNPAKAKALLKEAGYENGFTVILDAPYDRYVNDEKIAQAVASSLAKIGITVKVNSISKKELFPRIKKADTSFYLFGWACGDGDGSCFMDPIIHSHDPDKGYGLYNGGRYSNPEVDALIEKSSVTLDSEKRKAILIKAMHKALLEDQVIIPLHFQYDLYATAKNVILEHRADTRLYYFDVKLKN